MKSNLVEINYISDEGYSRKITFDLDSIKIISICEIKENQPFIHWDDPRFNESCPDIKCSLNELNKMFSGIFECMNRGSV